MQQTIPLSHHQADNEMLPLSAVGNKDAAGKSIMPTS